MELRLAHGATGTPAELRAQADQARARLARLTLRFPIAGSVIIIASSVGVYWLDGTTPDPATTAAALVQLWGLYGPYLVAITSYLWVQSRVPTSSEKAPNGWQMAMLAHSFTMQLIILIYSVPLIIYIAGAKSMDGANEVMGVYQSAVHTFTAAAITYFFARPEGEAPAKKR
jgi:hypothetical protein